MTSSTHAETLRTRPPAVCLSRLPGGRSSRELSSLDCPVLVGLGPARPLGAARLRREPPGGPRRGTRPRGRRRPSRWRSRAPVTGRWKALNSPADKVPSHGTRAYGQAYAIDIVAEPEAGARPGFGCGRSSAATSDFPAFGAPAARRRRRHRRPRRRPSARPPQPHLAGPRWSTCSLVEGSVRELGGAAPGRRQPRDPRPGRRHVRALRPCPARLAHRPHGRPGTGRAAARPVRQLRQQHRAARPLPADGRRRPGHRRRASPSPGRASASRPTARPSSGGRGEPR